MIKYSNFILIPLIVLLAFTYSCKKKNKDATDPGTKSITCKVSTDDYSSGSYSSNTSYTYDGNGLISSYYYSSTYSAASTTYYSYTIDANGKVTKKDAGSGNYTSYEYTSGNLSKFTEYVSNALNSYTTVEYQSDKTILKAYTPSSVLSSTTENTLSGDNITGTKITSYYTNGTTMSVSQYSNSNFDSKISSTYLLKKANPSVVSTSKNNPQNSSFSITSYDTNGAVITSSTTTYTYSYTYNSNGVVTQTNITTVYNSSAPTSSTESFSYSGCE